MNSEAKTEAASWSDTIADRSADSPAGGFACLRQAAALEFHASLQLLAERARFLTGAAGVAIAIEQNSQFVYYATAGSSVPEIDATADITKYPLRKCVETGQAVHLSIEPHSIETPGEGPHPALAMPVLKNHKVVGFFELVAGQAAFEDHDVDSVARLSVMVSTALDHLDAAEHTEKLIGKRKLDGRAAPEPPVVWHAPETTPSLAPGKNSQPPAAAEVHLCTACGFPVSGGRRLCVECETRPDKPNSHPDPAPKLFAVDKHESWISAHGYTIASLLVTALAAAIILWLR